MSTLNNQQKQLTQFVIYRRLSKQETTGVQYGFDSQNFDINNFLQTQKDYEIIGEYKEFFTGTGWYEDRPEFLKAVQHCQQTGATLLVQKVDRLARSVSSGAVILEKINVKIANIPNADNFTIHILLSVAEQEAKNISERTKKALQSAKERGVKLGGASTRRRVAYDTQYQSTKNKYQVYQKPLENMRAKGYTYDKIAEQFNLMGMTTSKGCSHTKASVNRIANYLGLI